MDREFVEIPKKDNGKRVERSLGMKKALYRLFHSISWMLNLFVLLLYLLAQLSTILSPEQLFFPALFGLGFPVLLGGVCFFLLYRLVKRQWKGFFFNLIFLVLTWGSISTYFPLYCKEKPIPEGAVKVLSLNCHGFGFLKHSEENPNPTLRYLKDSKADIICLQEAYTSRNSSPYVSMRKIARYLPEYPHVILRFGQKDRGTSLMLLSKYPVKDTRLLPLDSRFNGGVVYTLDVKGKEVQLYNLHLESFYLTDKDANEYVSLAKDGDPIGLTDKVTAKFTPAFKRRAAQADAIAIDCAQSKTPYVIICGDFNDTPISYTRSRIASNRIDAYAHSGCGVGASFKVKGFGVRIDHILHSEKIDSYQCRIDDEATISDHKPISCFVVLKD